MHTVHVVDILAPQFINCPSQTFTLGCNPTITMEQAIMDAGGATDNCGGEISYSASGGEITGTCTKTQTWTVVATDGCGNSNSCEVHYSWTSDTQIPAFDFCPGVVNLGCNPVTLPTSASVLTDAGPASDNCNIASVSAMNGPVTGTSCNKSQAWTVTAIDDCGNIGTCLITYNWTVDTEAPVFDNCPAGPIMRLCGSGPFTQFDEAIAEITAMDNCGGLSKIVTGGDVTGTCLKTQTYFVTETDACSNSSTCTVQFQWHVDTEAPVFDNCPAIPFQLGCVTQSQPVNEAQAITDAGTISDNCGITTVSAEIASTDVTGCFHSQTWLVTAFDACDQSSFCSVTYTWTYDASGPVFQNCPVPPVDLGNDPAPITSARQLLQQVW
jgi:hypothetical protein